MKENGEKGIQSIRRAAAILQYLAGNPKGARLTDLCNELELNKSTAFGILATLESLAYVKQNKENGRYGLGLKLFELGEVVQSSFDLVAAARPHISALCEKYEQTIHIAVLSENEIVYLDKVESTRSMRVSSQLGGRQPVYCTSLGKVLAAFLPEGELSSLADSIEYTIYTPKTISNKEALLEELKRVRAMGYAFDLEENEIGLSCVAAPIRNADGEVIAAISMAGTTASIECENIDRITEDVVNTGAAISANLGYIEKS